MKRVGSVLVVAGMVGLGVWGYFYAQSRGNTAKYRTARVERGPLTAAVSATGNLNAVITVQVGSQVSGQIKELLVDFNSTVRKGQVIARIDPQIFDAQVNQAKADLEAANAAVMNQAATVDKARADVENARAALAQAKAQTAKADVALMDTKRQFDRSAELFRRQLIAQADRDTSQANYEQAVAQSESARANEKALEASIQSTLAQLKVQEAQLQSARAQVNQKHAALSQAETNLAYTTIRAPVDGVVVSRAVDVGQTVAASLQAPTLFTIAQDLTKMQVETSVDEADIGRLQVEDRATFTVDAYPGRTFHGTVSQIRKAAQIVQNVVTYTVIVAVDNPGGRLLPGMTANVKLIVADKPSVLKIPNAALRFRPASAEAAAGDPSAPGAGTVPAARASTDQGRDRLAKDLGLDAEQQKKIESILVDSREQLSTLRGLPESERQAAASNIRAATRQRIRAVLTPSQAARYDGGTPGGGDWSAAGGVLGRVFVLDSEGKPRAVAVTLGISDGASTEVAEGELREGQEVIVSSAGSGSTKSTPGGSSPRLRL